LYDAPGWSWILGALFICLGCLAVAGPLGLFKNSAQFSLTLKLVVILLGLISLAGGVFAIYQTPLTETSFNRTRGEFVVRQRGVFREAAQRFPISDVSEVEIAQQRDSDGDWMYQIRLLLHSGQTVPLSTLWVLDHEDTVAGATAIRSFLTLPPRTYPEPEDPTEQPADQ
jgi:hypothetical protein